MKRSTEIEQRIHSVMIEALIAPDEYAVILIDSDKADLAIAMNLGVKAKEMAVSALNDTGTLLATLNDDLSISVEMIP